MTRPQPISRGRSSGGMLMLLGAWGVLIPFVGPYFGYAFTPDTTWTYTSGRLWLSILPGAAAFVGGALVVGTRRVAVAGAFLAALGGAWYVIGQQVTALVANGSITPGSPTTASGAAFGVATMKFLEELGFFYGVGVLIVFFAALAIGQARTARTAALSIQAEPAAGPLETAEFGAYR